MAANRMATRNALRSVLHRSRDRMEADFIETPLSQVDTTILRCTARAVKSRGTPQKPGASRFGGILVLAQCG